MHNNTQNIQTLRKRNRSITIAYTSRRVTYYQTQ
jgi:hypothetical protein